MSEIKYPRVLPIKGTGGQIELAKRAYFPYLVQDACPKCGVVEEISLLENYLSYPTTKCVEEVYMCHVNADEDGALCGHEWRVRVVPRLTLEIAAP